MGRITSIVGLALLAFACSKQTENFNQDSLTKVTLQTDWYAQAEHGGFYQALAKGYYKEVGLDVEIVPGGPNAMTMQKVAQGVADFSLGRSDQVIVAASRGVPVIIQGAIMQQDPQAIMFHRESGIQDFKDLDGKTIMAIPGSTFVRMLEIDYGISIDVIPMDFGMSRFLADKSFIQQCFITNEPFYVQQAGANVGTLLLSDSGFRPYRVWYCSRGFARGNPEVVNAFAAASIRGWQDYLTNDPTPANELIAASNPKQTPEFLKFGLESMISHQLVSGDPSKGEALGRVTKERIQEQLDQLTKLNLLETSVELKDIVSETILQTEPSSIDYPEGPNLIVNEHAADSITRRIISPGDMAAYAQTIHKQLFGEDEEQVLSVLYLEDFITHFLGNNSGDFWIFNCGDGYQSNFDRTVILANRPFFVLSVNGKPLMEWLEEHGNRAWGPHMVNIENNNHLLDPGHKNPWGVYELHTTTKEQIFADLGNHNLTESAQRGQQLYLDACASCHHTENSLLGGKVSTRTQAMLAQFATAAEPYFRAMLKDPQATNPLAEKMPSFAHWSEENVVDVIAFLKTTDK